MDVTSQDDKVDIEDGHCEIFKFEMEVRQDMHLHQRPPINTI
ncbi:hypothetical protein ALP42_103057 [Pseudomonas savastanoi pv. nerii]|uniref:Uncharacterized protein n=1 Tax=Pseudomonas savastanoi pv. nerii TaxID=360921 RepID=A0AB74BMM9_PSESS|nr:hypothetical protein AC519_2578 [Pseudomonas savastanoi]KPY65057.1 hypothetical protein ALO58_102941 [Pseudomonas savastanoi pv. savastanoi]RML74432.1 hypothetical protein ALQ90_102788 [Pseudomonas savastanoi pv. savastanoi]RMN59482.1 hypothetical protein ALQ55_102937 [Pseudomonas savastanoi pv. savastanoi]RMT82100.1 hypothetical protein ALP42_103057 [Pseudomonas savastanoi pv. nerii]